MEDSQSNSLANIFNSISKLPTTTTKENKIINNNVNKAKSVDEDYIFFNDTQTVGAGVMIYEEDSTKLQNGEVKGKVIFSLSELPMNKIFRTEYDNTLERTGKNEVILAGNKILLIEKPPLASDIKKSYNTSTSTCKK